MRVVFQPPAWVWGIEATITAQPLYRPPELSERMWARRQLKYMAKHTRVYLLPHLISFFHRREEDYGTCGLCPTSNWQRRGGGYGMRVSGFGRKRDWEFFINEHTIALFWLGRMRVMRVEEPRIHDALLERVWAASWFARGDPVRQQWLAAWAASDEAKDKWEEILIALKERQRQEANP